MSGGGFGIIGGLTESANDVYVLDKNLKITGQVLDLGLTERIYSVRFIQDKGYVVTFRQIDPFYVLDLSDPENPALKGELKIPGYSSYLHPITKDKILGIGKEGSNVKISLFDVKDPENPSEAAKYTLQEFNHSAPEPGHSVHQGIGQEKENDPLHLQHGPDETTDVFTGQQGRHAGCQ